MLRKSSSFRSMSQNETYEDNCLYKYWYIFIYYINDTCNMTLIDLIISSSGGKYYFLQLENEGISDSFWRLNGGTGLAACSNWSQGVTLVRGGLLVRHAAWHTGPNSWPPDGRHSLLWNNDIFFDLHKEQLHLSPLKMIDSAKYSEDNGRFLKAVFSFYTWSLLFFCLSLLRFSPCAREMSFIFPLVSVVIVHSVGFFC